MSRLSASSCGLRFGRVGLVPAPALPQAFAQHPRTRCPRGSPQAPPPGALAPVCPAANAREDWKAAGPDPWRSRVLQHAQRPFQSQRASAVPVAGRPGGTARRACAALQPKLGAAPPARLPSPPDHCLCWTPDPSRRSLGALAHLAPLALQAAGPLLLPLPPELGPRLLVRVRLVRHAGRSLRQRKQKCCERLGG